MRRSARVAIAVLSASLVAPVYGRDLGVLLFPVHQGKWTSSLLYEHLKSKDDFDSRGRADFKSDVVGSQFSYGITDQIGVSLKGGVLLEPKEEVQGSQYQSRAGYLYGLDVFNEVFPATNLRPGVQLSGGLNGFLVPFDRVNAGGAVAPIDQKLTGYEYHGAVLASWRLDRFTPYAGLRGFGGTMKWRNNSPAPGTPDEITGHAHGNISIVVGTPIQIVNDVRFQIEGRFVSETAVTAGFTVAAF